VLGFFGYFRDHIPRYAEIAKSLTDLTTKQFRIKFPWSDLQQRAFEKLKELLQQATEKPLYPVDFSKPFLCATAYML